jgi:hypothetical protein
MSTAMVGTRHGSRHGWCGPVRGLVALMVGALALGGVLLVGGHDAGAAAKKTTAKVSDATMAWGVSQYVLGANPAATSLAEVQLAESPTTFTEGTGWEFSDGAGTYDTKTGAMTIAFPGALEFGNTNAGNYGFKFASPTLALDATGTGTLTVDFSARPTGGGPFGAATKVVVVDVTGATPTTTKKHVEVEVTPTAFADPLFVATADLSAFFKPTGSSSDSFKPPAPITVEFDYKVKKPKS